MVQVVEYRRNLEPVRQFKDFFAIVEPIVVLNDKSILDTFRQALEVLCKAIECCFFIPVDAADMQDDFVGGVSAERGQDFIVINQILDGARDNIFVRRVQDGVLARVERYPHAASADFGADAIEYFLVGFRPIEHVDRT